MTHKLFGLGSANPTAWYPNDTDKDFGTSIQRSFAEMRNEGESVDFVLKTLSAVYRTNVESVRAFVMTD